MSIVSPWPLERRRRRPPTQLPPAWDSAHLPWPQDWGFGALGPQFPIPPLREKDGLFFSFNSLIRRRPQHPRQGQRQGFGLTLPLTLLDGNGPPDLDLSDTVGGRSQPPGTSDSKRKGPWCIADSGRLEKIGTVGISPLFRRTSRSREADE